MFINCRHCHALVATDPATDLPPERCPRCRGVLRRPDATPAPIAPHPPVAHAPPPAAAPARPAAPGTTDPVDDVAAEHEPASTPGEAAGAADAIDATEQATAASAEPVGEDASAAAGAPTGSVAPVAPEPSASVAQTPAEPAASAGDVARGPAVAPDAADAGTVHEPEAVATAHASTAADAPAPTAPAGAGDATSDAEATPPTPAVEPPTEAVAAATIVDAGESADAASTDSDASTPDDAPTVQAGDAATGDGAPPDPVFSAAPRAGTVRPAQSGRMATVAAIVALALLLAVQIVLADRERLAADASWRPLVVAACGVLGCDVPPWREPAAIMLVSREVRPHPTQANALHVRASFRNDARWSQAWPRLMLVLSDVNGRPVAARAFEPREYLGTAPGALLEPGQAVDIEFDIAEPSVATVAYTFDFRP